MNRPGGNQEAIVDGALALPADERAAFLDKACGADAPLRRLVEALLRAHEHAWASSTSARDDRSAEQTTESMPGISEKPGDHIGRYKLLEQIGEGGCGIVYMAEQEEPVRRRVALKIIKLGMDTKQVIARFEAERQALALMDHPNIAKVHDAGATETGRPYFVMELVRGVKITDYCDQNKLPTEERLQLFIQVCKAIQHAHQKGIIHRDVKPSNILVTLHDGAPVPKVIDFGIAKATVQRLTDKTLFTSFQQFVGTPAYMSPEQAEMSGLDIDTRSDIYSLGVLLYELLTGQLPFDSKRLFDAGLDELRRIIREEDPVRPSTRISTLKAEERTTVAKRRQVEAPRLISLMRGDLDWIVMKCLEKDRNRRYETANGLARDVERYLESEPVVARPPSAAYRLGKLVRRNRLVFGAAAAVMVAAAVGLAGILWQWHQARANALRAEKEATKSRQAARLLEQTFAGVEPSVARGMDTTLLTMILTSASERIGRELTNQPDVESGIRLVLGKTFFAIGQVTNATAQTRRALELGQQAFGPTNDTVADALANLGAFSHEQGQESEAEELGRQALGMRTALHGNFHTNVATSLNNVGLAVMGQGRFAEAEALLRQGLDIRLKILGNGSRDVAGSRNNLGIAMVARGDLDGAGIQFGEVLNFYKKRLGESDPAVCALRNNLAGVLSRKGDFAGAAALHEENLRWRRQTLHSPHPHLVYSLDQLAVVSIAQGNFEKAEPLLREASDMESKLSLGNSSTTAETLAILGTLLFKKGDLAGAESTRQRALDMQESLKGAEGTDNVIDSLDSLGLIKATRGDLAGGESLLEQALAMNRKLHGRDPDDAPDLVCGLWHLAWVLEQEQKLAEATQQRNEALGIGLNHGLYGLRTLTDGMYDIADVLQVQGKPAQTESSLLSAWGILETNSNATVILRQNNLRRLVRFYQAWDKAEPNAGKSAKAAEYQKKLDRLENQLSQPNPPALTNGST